MVFSTNSARILDIYIPKTVETVTDFTLGAPESLQVVTAAMKLKDTPWKESYKQPRQHIKKQRHYFANKGLSSQG